MSCFVWNCRGVGNAATVRDLCCLAKEANSHLVFLCETRQKADKVRRLRNRLGLRGFAGLDSVGMSGGLALFWHESVHVEIIDINERYIDAYVRLSVNDPIWHVTFVYGEPRVEHRHRMWSMLNSIKQSSNLPWLVLGDFNETLWQFEHFSKKKRSEVQMQAFRDVLQTCELHDLGFKGLPYTYDNKREGINNVRVRLDRAVADDGWRDMFRSSQVEHLISPCSDHCPVVLKFCVDTNQPARRKCLHYEIFWEREAELVEVIDESWAASGDKSDLADISRALSQVMAKLHSWSRRKCKNVGREIEKGRKRLAELIESGADSRSIRSASDNLHELLYREEMLWLQRSRVNWLKEGDRNT